MNDDAKKHLPMTDDEIRAAIEKLTPDQVAELNKATRSRVDAAKEAFRSRIRALGRSGHN